MSSLHQTEAQKVIQRLADEGLRPVDIVRRTGHRFSERTLYRWMRGECAPKQAENIRVLKRLLLEITVNPHFLLEEDATV